MCYGIIKWLNLDTGGTNKFALLPELVLEVLYIDPGAGARREQMNEQGRDNEVSRRAAKKR